MPPAAGSGSPQRCARSSPKFKGIEYRINIMDYMSVPPERITFGTADAWGYDGICLTLIDVKSGKQRDYKEQMAVYALGPDGRAARTEVRSALSSTATFPATRHTPSLSRKRSRSFSGSSRALRPASKSRKRTRLLHLLC